MRFMTHVDLHFSGTGILCFDWWEDDQVLKELHQPCVKSSLGTSIYYCNQREENAFKHQIYALPLNLTQSSVRSTPFYKCNHPEENRRSSNSCFFSLSFCLTFWSPLQKDGQACFTSAHLHPYSSKLCLDCSCSRWTDLFLTLLYPHRQL